MTVTKIPSAGIDLSGTFAFTGTVSGTPQDLVKISTTTISSQNTDITLPTGYKIYKLLGSNLVLGASGQAYDLYTTTDSFSSTDTDFESTRNYIRIENGGTGVETSDGYLRLGNNQANDATDNLSFEITLAELTTTRTTGYNAWGWSVYGHTNDQQSYVYTSGGRSQTTSVVNGLRVSCSTASGVGGTITLYGVVT